MATKRRQSAFAVYQQTKKNKMEEEGVKNDLKVVEPVKSSGNAGESLSKGSRKRRRNVFTLFEGKKKRKAEDSDVSLQETYSGQKVKRHGKKRKPIKSGSGDSIKKKRKRTIIKAHLKPSTKESSSETEELSTENGSYNDSCDLPSGILAESGEDVYSPFCLQFEPDAFEDSRDSAKDLFRLLINPVPVEQFYEQVWETTPLVVRRHKKEYNSGWFSSQELDTILRENDLEFGTNIDLTTYENGKRETHNPQGRAHASTVWEYFQSGCSVRLLNPATYSRSVWLLNSTLQEHFNSCVGANVYLTPADSQGFAPHFDDIEAFVLQLEGKKHWRVYAPKSEHKMLPLYSSGNFSEDDDLGKLVIDTILEPGDLLYFPRGFIHQASTLPESHSLHITVSTYQKNTWGTLLEKLLPAALQVATTTDVAFRRGLPTDYLNYMGLVNSDTMNESRRVEFCEKISELMVKLIDYAPVHAAVDELGMDHIHSSLPPVLTEDETKCTSGELGARWTDGGVEDGIVLTPDTEVKLIRLGAVRLAMEDEITLYYTLQNSKLYREKDLIGMQIHEDDAPAVSFLISMYPEFVRIDELPIQDGNDEDKVNLCYQLYSQGLLLIK